MGSEVLHYGIKGMHWGVRKSSTSDGGVSRKAAKAALNNPHPGYSSRQRVNDSHRFNKAAVKRINRRMNKGMDLKKARDKEVNRTLLKLAAAIAIYNSPKILRAINNLVETHGANTMASIRVKAQTNRGRAQAAATMGLPRRSTNGPSYARKSRDGVHKITTL
jgi:hypothetical protein